MAMSAAQVMALEWERASREWATASEQQARLYADAQHAWDRAHTPALYQLVPPSEPPALPPDPTPDSMFNWQDITRSTVPWWRSQVDRMPMPDMTDFWDSLAKQFGDPPLPLEIRVSKGL